MNAALVINLSGNDARIKGFARFWLENEPSDVLWLLSGDGTSWSDLSADGDQGTPLQKDERPTCVDCIFVHGSDFDSSMEKVRNQLTAGWTAGFIFNSPGDPPSKDDFIRILRPTADPFGLTSKHRDEIVGYIKELGKGTGVVPPLPSCCHESAKHLVALDILAQGYLFTHGLLEAASVPGNSPDADLWKQRRKRTESTDWWLRGLSLGSLDELQKELLDDQVAEVHARKVVELLNACAEPSIYASKHDERHPLLDLRVKIAELLR
jgi:hypothetical protein